MPRPADAALASLRARRDARKDRRMASSPRTVLVTGANRGLGLEFVRQYADEGWQVIAACRAPEAARELHKLAGGESSRIRMIALDVTNPASIRDAAVTVGTPPIDLLLNNAGVGAPRGERLGSLDYAAWARVLDANTLGPMRVVEAFVGNVAKSRDKRIVTVTSGMGSIGDNTSGGSYAYRSSKAAVNIVMKSLAVDLASRGITCVVVNPGWVRTDMGGPRGKLSPAESIEALRGVISKLKIRDSGKFLNYDGREYPW
jgi:NAD(P)-dependent dehydrogenase (short-subunit alcohol dehydrogenase family)